MPTRRGCYMYAVAMLAAPGLASGLGWIGLTADRNRELIACAKEYGGKVTFYPDSAWPTRDSGNKACSAVGAGACSKVIDWQCGVHACASTVEESRLAMCEGHPEPPAPPTPRGCRFATRRFPPRRGSRTSCAA